MSRSQRRRHDAAHNTGHDADDGTDPIDAYLDDLLGRLHGPASVVRRTLTEAETHLRDTADAELASDPTLEPAMAQQRALARFGSADTVAHAANRDGAGARVGALLAALIGSAVRMVAIGFCAIALAAVGARALAAVTSVGFVFGLPAGTVTVAAKCAHWLSVQPTAGTCAQAATLENASDTFQLYLGGALLALGAIGIIAGTTWLIRHGIRARRVEQTPTGTRIRLPKTLVPVVGTTVFGGTGLVLLSAAVTNLAVLGLWGRGLWYVEAVISLAIAAGYLVLFLRALTATTVS
ncbi:MAG: hypothetical protein EPN48_04035 [Microbacteriaceae bacterium]|nr:MAG: hypothetical protein EPN48_04035 [Microbacteriaceae bacterium]